MSIAIDNQFLTISELAQVLGIGKRTIERRLKEKSTDIPPSIKFGKKRKWHKQATNAWIYQRVGIRTTQVENSKFKIRSLSEDLMDANSEEMK